MPYYEYKCGKCGRVVEEYRKVSERNRLAVVECGEKACRLPRIVSPVPTTFKFADRRSIK